MFRIYYLLFCMLLGLTNLTFTNNLVDEYVSNYICDSYDEDFDLETEKNNPELIAYVKHKYEKNLFGLDHLIYAAQNPRKLYIIFSGAQKNKYNMWSWFWDSKEQWPNTAFLFLKDDSFRWYIGTKENSLISSYTNLIMHYIKLYKIHSSNIFTIGSSMGGYAALLYGIQLKVGSIFAARPQIDYQNAILNFGVKGLEESWVDLHDLVKKSEYKPKIYLAYGSFLPDKHAAHKFIDTLRDMSSSIVISHKTPHPLHAGFAPSKDFVLSALKYLDKITHDGIMN